MKDTVSRRQFLAMMLGGVIGWGVSLAEPVSGNEYLDYETLSMKLYVKTKKEASYLKDVVEKRDKGLLPQSVFHASYNYALKKGKVERIYYFDACLSALCKKTGLNLQFEPLR